MTSKEDKEKEEHCCAICLEDMNYDIQAPSSSVSRIICCMCPTSCYHLAKQPVIVLPCGHAFHPGCIRAWMYVGGIRGYSCPMCRRLYSHCCVPEVTIQCTHRTVVVWLVLLYGTMLAVLAIFIVVLDLSSERSPPGNAGRHRMLLEARAPPPLTIVLN
jgi:hypothetical protein